MATKFDARLKMIDRNTLTPLVKVVLDSATAEIVDWRAQTIHGGTGDFGAGISGVARFSGIARDGAANRDWSLILKILPLATNPADPDEATRELHAYQSGLLSALPGGLTAPRCLATVETPGETPGIWMEDVDDDGSAR